MIDLLFARRAERFCSGQSSRLRKKAKNRHSEAPFAEESLILLILELGGIPRSARNDVKRYSFAACLAAEALELQLSHRLFSLSAF